MSIYDQVRQRVGGLLNRTGLGMRGKRISLFVIIEELRLCTRELARKANEALAETGDIASVDAIAALDNSARGNIERLTTDTAQRVAAFLYDR